MSELKISIAMTTFNGERFLQEQLESFLWQTRLPDELVVCDDGSTDRTLEILEAFAKKAPFPVKIYRNPQRLGFSKNFEKAALMCSGDLIAFSDQDDVWLPEKLDRCEKVFERDNKIGIFIHNAFVVDEKIKKIYYQLWDRIKNKYPNFFGTYYHFLRDYAFNGNSMVVKYCLLEKILPIPPYWTYDKWIPFVAIYYTKPYYEDMSLIHYRIHNSQTAFRMRQTNLVKIKNHLKNTKIDDIYSKRYYKWLFAEKCLPFNYKKLIEEDIQNKINIIANMLGEHFRSKLLNIFKYYLLGHYHKYEHGTRSMLRDIILTFFRN